MSDSYQAIYDAVRSKIGSPNWSQLFHELSQRFDISNHIIASVAQEFTIAAHEMQRPSVLYRPTLRMYVDSKPGKEWTAEYNPGGKGTRVAGSGDTPEAAMAAFDEVWRKK